jgi:type I restriction enzyme, R subunit
MAKVRVAVTKTLIREKVTGQALQFKLKAVVKEAKEKYKDWPIHA